MQSVYSFAWKVTIFGRLRNFSFTFCVRLLYHLRNVFFVTPMKIKQPRRRVIFFASFIYSLSLQHFLATLNTTSSSSPRTPSQKVPARQETTTNSGSEAKASTSQPMLTKVSVETKESKYTKHQKQNLKRNTTTTKKRFLTILKKELKIAFRIHTFHSLIPEIQ